MPRRARLSWIRLRAASVAAGFALSLLVCGWLLPAQVARADGLGSFVPPASTPQPRPSRTPRPAKPAATPLPGRKLVLPGVAGGDAAAVPAPAPSSTHIPPPAAMPASEMDALRVRMAAAIAGYGVPGSYAIAVTDLQTGMMVSVNGSRQQISGCVMNIFVLISALLDVERGAYPLTSVAGLIESTLWSSNAASARQLYAQTGGGNVLAGVGKVQALVDSLGLSDLFLDHAPGYPWESRGLDANNWVTAEHVNWGLAALYHGAVLAEPQRSYLLDTMTQVMPGLNYLLGSGLTGVVSHKNGWLEEHGEWVDNDAGIVRFTRGEHEYAYAVTFLAMDVDVRGTDVPLGQSLTRMIWEHFSGFYNESLG